MGFASDGRGWARPSGRALRVSGGAPSRPPARYGLRCRAARDLRLTERPTARPLRQVPVQRPHGAAPAPDVAVPAAAAVRDAGLGGPTDPRAALDHGGGAGGDAPGDRGGDVHGTDCAVA